MTLPPIRSHRPDEEKTLARGLAAGWVQILGLTPPSGKNAAENRRQRDALFGAERWSQGWLYNGRVIDRTAALVLYEEGYVVHFEAHPEDLDWICRTASEVYDIAPSNVASGFDYGIQELAATHMQDISVRRAVVRLGRAFQGDHLVEIRKRDSEGFRLNPGSLPFHEPEAILPYPHRSWWEALSIEAFWQHNKVLLVDPDAIRLRPWLVGPDGIHGDLDESLSIFVPISPSSGLARVVPSSEARALWSVPAPARKHAQIDGAPWVSWAEAKRRDTRFPEGAVRVAWSELKNHYS
jgi:hypothetical protein